MKAIEFWLSKKSLIRELLPLLIIIPVHILCFTGFTIGTKTFRPIPIMSIVLTLSYTKLFLKCKEYYIPKIKIMDNSIRFYTTRVFRKAVVSVLNNGDEVRVGIDTKGRMMDISWGDSFENQPKSIRLELSNFSIEDRKTLKEIFSTIKEKGKLEMGDFR